MLVWNAVVSGELCNSLNLTRKKRLRHKCGSLGTWSIIPRSRAENNGQDSTYHRAQPPHNLLVQTVSWVCLKLVLGKPCMCLLGGRPHHCCCIPQLLWWQVGGKRVKQPPLGGCKHTQHNNRLEQRFLNLFSIFERFLNPLQFPPMLR